MVSGTVGGPFPHTNSNDVIYLIFSFLFRGFRNGMRWLFNIYQCMYLLNWNDWYDRVRIIVHYLCCRCRCRGCCGGRSSLPSIVVECWIVFFKWIDFKNFIEIQITYWTSYILIISSTRVTHTLFNNQKVILYATTLPFFYNSLNFALAFFFVRFRSFLLSSFDHAWSSCQFSAQYLLLLAFLIPRFWKPPEIFSVVGIKWKMTKRNQIKRNQTRKWFSFSCSTDLALLLTYCLICRFSRSFFFFNGKKLKRKNNFCMRAHTDCAQLTAPKFCFHFVITARFAHKNWLFYCWNHQMIERWFTFLFYFFERMK